MQFIGCGKSDSRDLGVVVKVRNGEIGQVFPHFIRRPAALDPVNDVSDHFGSCKTANMTMDSKSTGEKGSREVTRGWT